MNFDALKIEPGNDDFHKPSTKFIKTDAFTVLPPFSPQIPGPPPTSNPYRILPPIVSRKKPSFVILQEVGSRPTSREPSPSGRVSPFRGCGFKPHSRETSPSRLAPPEDAGAAAIKLRRSRSRLPIALCRAAPRKLSKSVSPVSRHPPISGIPRPLLKKRTSYSPNRATKILTEINNNQQPKGRSVERFENLYGRRAVSQCNLKECAPPPKVVSRVQKPTFAPRNAKATPCVSRPKSNNTIPKIPQTPTRTSLKNDVVKAGRRQIPVSPVRAAKYEPTTMKSKENLSDAGKRAPLSSPVRGKIVSSAPKSPSKHLAARSKENLSPTSKVSNTVRTKSPNKLTSSSPARVSPRSPRRATSKMTTKKPTPGTTEDKSSSNEPPASVTAENDSIPALPEAVEQKTEEQKEVGSNKFSSVRAVGKKALTTSNLLNAIKNKNAMNERADADKKELPHADTSISLPISVGGAGMTESAVTLIRTTTEPALAPVQPALISEIRSAMADIRNVEETHPVVTDQQDSPSPDPVVNSPISPTLPAAVAESAHPTSSTDQEKKYRTSSAASTSKIEQEPSPSPTDSPHFTHVTAITKSEELDPEGSVLRENQNGIDKSSWLNEQSPMTPMKKVTGKLNAEKPVFTGSLPRKKLTPWEKLRSQSSIRSHHPVRVSTITKASTMATTPSKRSCCRKYFCCFCYKCKLKKRQGMNVASTGTGDSSSTRKCFSCFGCQNSFKSILGTLHCCGRKMIRPTLTDTKTDSSVSRATTSSSSLPGEQGCCARHRDGVFKCLGIMCCVNSSVCLSLRNKVSKLYSGCRKCLCCSVKRQTVITESERRRSTISTAARKPRKWTRVFTDFPKLDSSFVDHASVMRGAIPVLPVPLAWICLILNVFLPGFGTLSSGVFCLFVGKPRFSINDSLASRFGSFLVNLLVAGSQLFTVLFCLVGWGWSVWWGVIMLRMAKKNKRILLAEQVANETRAVSVANQNYDSEKGGTT